MWFRLREDATSFVLREGRLWFLPMLHAVPMLVRTQQGSHTRNSCYSVCSPFVILSEANHVRQKEGGSFLVSMHAENRRGGNVDSSWASCLMKIFPRFLGVRKWKRLWIKPKSGVLQTSGWNLFIFRTNHFSDSSKKGDNTTTYYRRICLLAWRKWSRYASWKREKIERKFVWKLEIEGESLSFSLIFE